MHTSFATFLESPRLLSPYIIAEIGVNHEGNLPLAKKLIELAKEGGAHAAKFQTYKADRIASKHSPAYWDLASESTESQFELFKKYDAFGEKEYRELAAHCEKVGIEFVSTPFDKDAVEFLDPLMPFFKIASADITNKPLLRQIASKGKPVILSTGAATLEEIDSAVQLLKENNCTHLSLLHCVLNYPTPDENANLRMIQNLSNRYPSNLIGYSDHTVPTAEMTTLIASVLLGARVIEKHFTHDKSLPGNDHYHAMDVNDLENFCTRCAKLETLCGAGDKSTLEKEESARQHARRSIVADTQIQEGEVILESMITYKRPGTGIPVADWDRVVGSTANCTIEHDQVFQWSMIKE